MGKGVRGGLIALGCVYLLGCAAQLQQQQTAPPISEAQAIAQLRTGAQLLRCREACLPQWRQAEPQAALFARYRYWRPLATLVLNTGYQDDLTLYYLGFAAEGLGYPGAAASYYRQSLQLSGTTIACANLSRLCADAVLPRDASARLAALEISLRRPVPERSRRRRGREEEPPAAAEPVPLVPAAEPEPFAPSSPSPAPMPAPPPPPPPPPNPAASQFIEPPPAPR